MSLNDASRIVIDDYRVMLQIVASLTVNSRGVNYNNIGTVFTTLNFCRNLRMGPISWSACHWPAFLALCNVMLYLIGPIMNKVPGHKSNKVTFV
jgi:hypothetical protein